MNLVVFLFADFLYRHCVTFDSVTTEVEILDTSKCAVSIACAHKVADEKTERERPEVVFELAIMPLS